MPFLIDLPPAAERRLRERAANDGVDPAAMASTLVQQSLVELPSDVAAVEAADQLKRLFAGWEAEDPVTGPDDLAQREREFEEFKMGMNAASTRGRPIFP